MSRHATNVTLHLYWFERLHLIAARLLLDDGKLDGYLHAFVRGRVTVEVLDK